MNRTRLCCAWEGSGFIVVREGWRSVCVLELSGMLELLGELFLRDFRMLSVAMGSSFAILASSAAEGPKVFRSVEEVGLVELGRWV